MSSISYTGKILNTYPAIEYMHECCHGFCGACPFAKSNNGLDKPCHCLDLIDIYSIYEKSKEDKKMNKKEEIQQEIERTQKQLAALQEKLKEAEDEVPDELDFSEHNYCGVGWYVGIHGKVKHDTFNPKINETDQLMIKNHRAFKSEKYAKIFAEKTQLIADMLHFKYLYDRDYEPDWNKPYSKWTVWIQYDNAPNKFVECSSLNIYDPEKIYFSSKELAQKCADWLNKKYGKE